MAAAWGQYAHHSALSTSTACTRTARQAGPAHATATDQARAEIRQRQSDDDAEGRDHHRVSRNQTHDVSAGRLQDKLCRTVNSLT